MNTCRTKSSYTNTAINSFNVAEDQADEFVAIFQTLKDAELLQDLGDGKTEFTDVTSPTSGFPVARSGGRTDQETLKGVGPSL